MAKNDNSTLGVAPETARNSLPNAVDFMVRQIVKGLVNTAKVVKVVAAYPGGTDGPAGYVDILPLVCELDADGNVLSPTTIYHVPYFRLQAGVAAVVIDPVPGDIGVAVIAQSDSSAVPQVATQPVQPGSYRRYSEADSFYVGGFLNKAPSAWIELTQEGIINITAKNGVNIDTPNVTISGDIICGGFSFLGHTHTGVHGETSTPH